MTASEYVVEVLGGPSVFKGRAVPTSTELRERIKQGLPFRSLESVRERLRLSVPEAAMSFTCRLGRWRGADSRGD